MTDPCCTWPSYGTRRTFTTSTCSSSATGYYATQLKITGKIRYAVIDGPETTALVGLYFFLRFLHRRRYAKLVALCHTSSVSVSRSRIQRGTCNLSIADSMLYQPGAIVMPPQRGSVNPFSNVGGETNSPECSSRLSPEAYPLGCDRFHIALSSVCIRICRNTSLSRLD